MPRSTLPSRSQATVLLARLSVTFFLVVVWCNSGGVARAVGEPAQQAEWPLNPVPAVVRPFDPPPVAWAAGHRGVDLAAHPGQTVRSAMAGRISFVGTIASVPVVVVDSGAMRTTYQPVLSLVSAGATVHSGTAIGSVGTHHSHCAPQACLHWGLIRNLDEVYLDPLSLLTPPRVRLLPLWRHRAVGSPPGTVDLGSRMGLLERPTQAVSADMGVELGRGQAAVANISWMLRKSHPFWSRPVANAWRKR